MAKTRYTLPDPPGCGGSVVMILVACLLVTVNSTLALSLIGFIKRLVPEDFSDARWEQVILFMLPVLGLVLEFWGITALMRFLWQRRGNGVE